MSSPLILIVDDDTDICTAMKIYFHGFGFEVEIAMRGSDVLEKTKFVLPNLIILDVMLPDIDGYEVCRNLKSNSRTSHIPVFFLTQKDERSDRLQGLELGAEDYITKPFDILELKLRVRNAIKRSEQENLRDPLTGLPAGRLIEEQLRRILKEKGWALINIRINQFKPFKDIYGFVAGEEVLRFTALMIVDVMNELGIATDFIGCANDNDFIVISTEAKASSIKLCLKERFNEDVQTHYNFLDRQQGFIQVSSVEDGAAKVPLMTLSVGVVLSKDVMFNDIRELVDQVANAGLVDS